MTEAAGRVPHHGTCLTCRWASEIDPSDYTLVADVLDFECRRHVPQVVAAGMDCAETYWPTCKAFDWCGEWEAAGR